MRGLSKSVGQLLSGFLLLCLYPAGIALALPPAEPDDNGLLPERLALLDRVLHQEVNDGRVPGLVAAVARNGRVAYMSAAGWQNLEAGIPMQEQGIFQIRSMSKPVTALAVMQQIEAGAMRLTDPVSDYIPSFARMQVLENPRNPEGSAMRAASRDITIEDLLLHTGGLSHRFSPLYSERGVRSRDDTLEQLVEKVAAQPLIADPGTVWNYSISTTVLGRIVEIVSERTFDEYLHERIFAPLGMDDTGFHIPRDKRDRQVMIYRVPEQAGEGFEALADMPVPITRKPALFEGAAGLVSTVPDYLRFLQAMLNGGELDGQRVLSEEGVVLLTENQLDAALMPINLSGRALPALGWGYGFSVVEKPEESAFAANAGEFGWNGSLGTFSWADPQTGTVAILMMQISPSGAWDLAPRFKSLLQQALAP